MSVKSRFFVRWVKQVIDSRMDSAAKALLIGFVANSSGSDGEIMPSDQVARRLGVAENDMKWAVFQGRQRGLLGAHDQFTLTKNQEKNQKQTGRRK